MKITLRLPVKRLKKEFKVDQAFKTKSEVTKRTVEIGEAFGIGVDDEHEFVVFKDFAIDVNPGDVVYITGDSGSGKSILLKQLTRALQDSSEFGGVAPEAEPSPQEILVEGVGRNTNEAVNVLSMAGLNEAFLMLRRYRELSDGQKYRYRIAKAIDSGAGVWSLDEFCATLDRTTAKVVAYCVQKTARKLGKTVLVATTHEDLLMDLKPSLHVVKRFGADVYAKRCDSFPPGCSLLRDAKIEEGSYADYQALERFHYRGRGHRSFAKHIFRATLNGELAGVILYGLPHHSLAARNRVLPQYLAVRRSKGGREYLRLVNRDFIRIWRVVVLPKYRSIGLGVKLVKETMPLVGKPYVEMLAVMAKYSPFAEKAGMARVNPIPHDANYEKALHRLNALGFSIELLPSKKHCLQVLSRLTAKQMEDVKRVILRHFVARGFRRPGLKPLVVGGDAGAMAEALRGVRVNPTYLVWKNPDPRFKDHPAPALPRDQEVG